MPKTHQELIYLCPVCKEQIRNRVIDYQRTGIELGLCSRPETVIWKNGERIVADPGCRNRPPVNLAFCEQKIVDVIDPDPDE
jgi:hypothetical protein